ncbi:MAG: conjugal transfer protein TraN [Pseudomonadota bacterium]
MITAIFFLLLFLPSVALSQSGGDFQGFAQDAFGNAQRFTDFSRSTAEDVLGVPVETDLPQSDMGPGDLEDAGRIMSGSDTIQGNAYSTFTNNVVDWSVSAADQSLLGVADGAVSNPDALVDSSTFSTSGGVCTVDEFEDGPVFERVCTSQRDQVQTICSETADIAIYTTQRYGCVTLNYAGGACANFRNTGDCTLDRTSCAHGFSSGGGCAIPRYEFVCTSDDDARFTNDGTAIRVEVMGAPAVSDPIITWTETCDSTYAVDRCFDPQGPVCTSGPSVEIVNDVLVPMDCTERETSWTCLANTYSSDCDVFHSDGSCSLISSECFSENPDGQCGAYENTFRCGSEHGGDFDASCEAVNVCVGGSCQSIPNEQNDELISALIAIETLNTMAEDSFNNADPFALMANPDGVAADINYFGSRGLECRIGILATLNCCRDSGWALGTIAQCTAEEMELYASQEAGSAVYVETYCSVDLLFVCAQRARRYCVFNSRLAKIVSYQGQHQLYGNFSCRAMTQDELEQIDWNQIDFTEAFGDLYANVGDIAPTELTNIIQNNILLAHPEVQDVYE